jgi:hypothetical protein
LLSSHCVWCREHYCWAVWCHGCGHCAACGSPSPSLRHVWCCHHGRCATWVLQVPVLRRVWCHGCSRCAAWVSRVPSLHRVWCCGCCRHIARGVAGAVVGLRGVMVAVVVTAPHVGRRRRLCAACGVAVAVAALHVGRRRRLCAAWVLWSRSLWWLSSCHVVLQPRSWSSCRHWTTKEEVSSKKEKRKCTSRPTRCMQPRRDKRVGHIYISHKII